MFQCSCKRRSCIGGLIPRHFASNQFSSPFARLLFFLFALPRLPLLSPFVPHPKISSLLPPLVRALVPLCSSPPMMSSPPMSSSAAKKSKATEGSDSLATGYLLQHFFSIYFNIPFRLFLLFNSLRSSCVFEMCEMLLFFLLD